MNASSELSTDGSSVRASGDGDFRDPGGTRFEPTIEHHRTAIPGQLVAWDGKLL